MKKNGTLIMLLAVFILTAAFGKTAEADGVEPAQHEHIWEPADARSAAAGAEARSAYLKEFGNK